MHVKPSRDNPRRHGDIGEDTDGAVIVTNLHRVDLWSDEKEEDAAFWDEGTWQAANDLPGKYGLTYTVTTSYKIREVMSAKSRARRCAGDFEVPRQIRLIHLIPERNTDAKSAGIVQGALRVTTNTTDDMELALERYFGECDGDGDHSHATRSSRFSLCRA